MKSGSKTSDALRRNIVTSRLGSAAAVIVFGLVAIGSGCESASMQTLLGARHYAAGNDALARNHGERAIEELERAAALVPHASEIQNHLGLAYWSEGRLGEARTAFEQALELDCENQAAESNLESLMTSSADVRGRDPGRVVQLGDVEHGR